jgi:hypothetical protein
VRSAGRAGRDLRRTRDFIAIEHMFAILSLVGIFDDPTNPFAIESLRRSVAMLTPGEDARIERDRALNLLEELRRLQDQQRTVAGELRAMLQRLESSGP